MLLARIAIKIIQLECLKVVSCNQYMKPTFEEVYSYAKKYIEWNIRKKASKLPKEIKEEISQDAYLRVWQAYENLDPTRGWRSFIRLHCSGALLDYLKGGKGSLEDSLESERLEIRDKDGTLLSEEDILGLCNVYHVDGLKKEKFQPNWELLSRLVSLDQDLHIVCKVLLGFSQEAIAAQLITEEGKTISRERVGKRVSEFFHRMDSIVNLGDDLTEQMIYALGLCKFYHMPDTDLGLGWDLQHFNLYDPDSFRLVSAHLRDAERQMSFNLDSELS